MGRLRNLLRKNDSIGSPISPNSAGRHHPGIGSIDTRRRSSKDLVAQHNITATDCLPLDDLRGQNTWEEEWREKREHLTFESDFERRVHLLIDVLSDQEVGCGDCPPGGPGPELVAAQMGFENEPSGHVRLDSGDSTYTMTTSEVSPKIASPRTASAIPDISVESSTEGDKLVDVVRPSQSATSSEDCRSRLQAVMSRRSNSTCADCTALDPTWASTNLGIFLCTQCSGCHRSLGTHISAVLSCQLDEWKPDQVSFMEHMGNEMANSFWEHHVPSEWPKPSDKEPRNYRELYIKAKYADRAFVYRLRKAPIIKQPPVSDPELDMETTTSKPTQVGMTEYSGFLNITLNRGKNLLPMKIMGQKHNKYMVIFRVGSQEVRSRRVKSDTCPEWNESLMLCWDGEMPLSIHVYGGREHVGQADVDLKQLLLGTDGRTLPNAQMSAATVTEALNEGEEEEEGEDAEDGDTEDVGSPAITSDVDEQCDATSQQGSIHRQISKRRSSTGSVASNASEMTACAAEESEQPDSQPTVPETFVPLTNRDTGLWSPKKGSSTPGSSSDKDGKRDSYGKVRLKMHHLGRGSAIIGHRPAQGGICIQVSFTKIDH